MCPSKQKGSKEGWKRRLRKKIKSFGVWDWVALFFALLALAFLMKGLYMWRNLNPESGETIGDIGDFIGGTAGTLGSLAALIYVIHSVRIQQEALARQRKEAKKSLEMQERALAQQREEAKKNLEMQERALAQQREEAKKNLEMQERALAQQREEANKNLEVQQRALAQQREEAKKNLEVQERTLAQQRKEAKKNLEVQQKQIQQNQKMQQQEQFSQVFFNYLSFLQGIVHEMEHQFDGKVFRGHHVFRGYANHIVENLRAGKIKDLFATKGSEDGYEISAEAQKVLHRFFDANGTVSFYFSNLYGILSMVDQSLGAVIDEAEQEKYIQFIENQLTNYAKLLLAIYALCKYAENGVQEYIDEDFYKIFEEKFDSFWKGTVPSFMLPPNVHVFKRKLFNKSKDL